MKMSIKMTIVVLFFAGVIWNPTEAAVTLSSQYDSVVPTGRGGSIAVPAASMQAILMAVGQHAAVWSTAAGSTSHDVRANLLQLITANIPAGNQGGMLMAIAVFCALVTNRNRLIKAITKVANIPGGQAFFTALGVNAAMLTGLVQNYMVDWVQEEVFGASIASTHVASSIPSLSVMTLIVSQQVDNMLDMIGTGYIPPPNALRGRGPGDRSESDESVLGQHGDAYQETVPAGSRQRTRGEVHPRSDHGQIHNKTLGISSSHGEAEQLAAQQALQESMEIETEAFAQDGAPMQEARETMMKSVQEFQAKMEERLRKRKTSEAVDVEPPTKKLGKTDP